MRSICVYCGSSPDRRPEYLEVAGVLARLLVTNGIGLVYGGGRVGVMGTLADAVMAAGGEVTGIIPQDFVDKEVAHGGLTGLHVVGSMHERKALMADLADAFIALPGGFGTVEELFEILTWAQLGLHEKPCGLLNVGGYYDALTAFLDFAVVEKFVQEQHRMLLIVEEDPEALLKKFEAYEAQNWKSG